MGMYEVEVRLPGIGYISCWFGWWFEWYEGRGLILWAGWVLGGMETAVSTFGYVRLVSGKILFRWGWILGEWFCIPS